MLSRFGSSWETLVVVTVSTLAIFLAVIVYTRISGLRSFSKMSSFDFAITIAIGSMLASVGISSTSLLSGTVALGLLFGIQAFIAMLRRRAAFSKFVDNQPRLLMAGDRFMDENLRQARITDDDVRSKLREANVHNYDQVLAVVLESTGDISVIHGDAELDLDILHNVADSDELRQDDRDIGLRQR